MQKLIELLTDKPLYSKIETEEFYEPSKLHDTKFDFYCNHEKSIKTFNLEIAHDLLDRASEELSLTCYSSKINIS